MPAGAHSQVSTLFAPSPRFFPALLPFPTALVHDCVFFTLTPCSSSLCLPRCKFTARSSSSSTSASSMGTKRKIPIQKRETREQRSVAFSKRRKGLFKKAADLCSVTGAKIAILAAPPSGRPGVFYTFGVDSVESVIDYFLHDLRPSQASLGTSTELAVTSNPRAQAVEHEQNEGQGFGFSSEEEDFDNCWDIEDLQARYREIQNAMGSILGKLNCSQISGSESLGPPPTSHMQNSFDFVLDFSSSVGPSMNLPSISEYLEIGNDFGDNSAAERGSMEMSVSSSLPYVAASYSENLDCDFSHCTYSFLTQSLNLPPLLSCYPKVSGSETSPWILIPSPDSWASTNMVSSMGNFGESSLTSLPISGYSTEVPVSQTSSDYLDSTNVTSVSSCYEETDGSELCCSVSEYPTCNSDCMMVSSSKPTCNFSATTDHMAVSGLEPSYSASDCYPINSRSSVFDVEEDLRNGFTLTVEDLDCFSVDKPVLDASGVDLGFSCADNGKTPCLSSAIRKTDFFGF